jgi:hypothetical protein
MGALCVRRTPSLGAAYRTQIPQLNGVLVYHAPELGFLAPALGHTLRVRTAMAQSQLAMTDSDTDMRKDIRGIPRGLLCLRAVRDRPVDAMRLWLFACRMRDRIGLHSLAHGPRR